MPRRLLIIEQTSSPLESCLEDLRSMAPNLICEHIGWGSLLPERLCDSKPDLIMLAAVPMVPQALSFFHSLQENPVVTPMLAIVPDGVNGELVRLASQVCDDFIIAPVRCGELCYRVTRILGEEAGVGTTVHERLAQEIAFAGLVGRDPAFLHTVGKIPLAARSNGPVLIIGETGTGKELCARAIHSLGPRCNFPFIPVDCATLPNHLFESELFGHVRGAFTDAHRDQKGLIALAEGGTLFLDEIDSLSLSAQSKLLRFLQERTYRPLGSDRFVRINVNVVAASNNDLEDLVRKKEFRSDLFFRLNVFRLYLVPLRERRLDITLLAQHFLSAVCAENDIKKTLAPATLRKLSQYDWPGNIRELYNVIQRAAIFSEGTQILPSHIDDQPEHSASESIVGSFREARSRAIESFERRYVEELLRECDGNVSRAARLAQKDRRAFGRLVKRYNIKREPL